MQLDKWQTEVLAHEGNLTVCSGRQVGKSTVIAQKAAMYALSNPGVSVIIGAAIERQASLIFWTLRNFLVDNFKSKIKGKMTLKFIELRNKSKIRCVPIGDTGVGIRGFTANMLIIDEAAFVNEKAWRGITPLLATTQGSLILISTPFGDEGYFVDCMNDPTFKHWHVSSEDCPRITKEFLEGEKRRLTKLEYAQEYLGKPLSALMKFFPTELIEKAQSISTGGSITVTPGDRFLGVDVARMGEDETVLVSLSRTNKELTQFDQEIAHETPVTETARRIRHQDKARNYKKIYIDTGGVGGGVYDILREEIQTRRKVVEINNARRSTDYNSDKDMRVKILKEDLYNNLKNLMEAGKIKLFIDSDLRLSLKSIQYEYTDDKRLKIFGRYDHIVEALVRAAWCMRDKTLNIWVC